MFAIHLICVGKLKEPYYRDASAEYEKRLSAFCRLKTTEITPASLPENPSAAQIEAALDREGKLIASKIPPNAKVYVLCVEGRQLSSEDFGASLEKAAAAGEGTPVFIIGGSHGLSEEVKAGASVRLSMSAMTFPHRLARVMLLEQLYRGFMINAGGKYHK